MVDSSLRWGQLAATARGRAWLSGFEPADQDAAAEALAALTLVSHSEFDRGLIAAILTACDTIVGPIAIFATRELAYGVPYFHPETGEVHPLAPGPDQGSEARIAATIRNLCKTHERFLNHPSLEEIKKQKCRAIFAVDDLIGSGQRTSKFLNGMWLSSTIRSWHSYRLIKLMAVAYTGTEKGIAKVEDSTFAKVVTHRGCPTFKDMKWLGTRERKVRDVLTKYGRRIARGASFGYGNIGVALVFEHSCPNNCPVVFWHSGVLGRNWTAMFPNKTVDLPEASVFPHEIQTDPQSMLIGIGASALVKTGALSRRGPIGVQILSFLSLVQKGMRKRNIISSAMGITIEGVIALIERCIRWGFVSPTIRLTPAGFAELNYARRGTAGQNKVPLKGEDMYYPTQLRGSKHG